ncbi:hypothetical protein BD626DRAFT_456798 [Schizophyllum amplum]|uniref:HNH nuclease domain-containing protein n=1 Tax=Schizophyllum amplum TaxID=97359 RepID=A0A550CF82_9AGAR|nr:hypothetical protein BD626DRAFT_456798 [Auriculariopsis ampla]
MRTPQRQLGRRGNAITVQCKATRVAPDATPEQTTDSSSSILSQLIYRRPVDPIYISPTQVYKPYRRAHIGFITPPGNRVKEDPRPSPEDLEKVAPAGARCAATGKGNKNRLLQIGHVADRATCIAHLRAIEIAFGLEPEEMNLDTRPNLIFLTPDMHASFDRGLWIILPMKSVLNKLLMALLTKTSHDCDREGEPKKNSHGFLHHEDVFEFSDAGRKFMLVPLSNWDEDEPITIIKRNSMGKLAPKVYTPPFVTPVTKKPQLPLMTLHCSPYFVVWKAYWALTRPGVTAPEYATAEVRTVMHIGQIMMGQLTTDDNSSASSNSGTASSSSPLTSISSTSSSLNPFLSSSNPGSASSSSFLTSIPSTSSSLTPILSSSSSLTPVYYSSTSSLTPPSSPMSVTPPSSPSPPERNSAR